MLVEETGNERQQTSKIKTMMHNPFSFLVHKLRRNKLMRRHSIEKGYTHTLGKLECYGMS